MGEEDNIRKKKGSSGRMKPKPIEVRAIGDSDDDDEPIGSLFKFKKPRIGKRSKSGFGGGKVDSRVEKSVIENVDLGGMDDTLASFRKKLKGPRIAGDGGSGALNPSSVRAPVDEPVVVPDSPLVECLGGFAKVKGKRRQTPKKKREESETRHVLDSSTSMQEEERSVSSVRGSVKSSDENMKDLLSGFVRKASASTVKKSRSSSKRKSADGMGKTSASVSPEPPLRVMPKSEAGNNPMCDRISVDPLLVKGRESYCASSFDGHLDETSVKSSEDEPISAIVGKISSTRICKETAKAQRSVQVSCQVFNLIQKDVLPVSAPASKEETAKFCEGQFNIFSGGVQDYSLAALQPSDLDSIMCLREKSEVAGNNELNGRAPEEGMTLCDGGLDRHCDGPLKDLVSDQFQEYSSVSTQMQTQEFVRSDDRLNCSSNSIPGVSPLSVTRSCVLFKSGDPLNGVLEGTGKESHASSDDCLDKSHEETKNDLPANVEKVISASNINETIATTRCDEMELSFENSKAGVSFLERKSLLSSMPKQMDQIHLYDDGFNKLSDGILKDLQSVQLQTSSSSSGRGKIEETSTGDNVNRAPDESFGDPTTVAARESQLASVVTQKEETSRVDHGFDKLSDRVLSVLPSEAAEESDLCFALNDKEKLTGTEFAMGSTTFIKKSFLASPQTQASDDMSEKAFDHTPTRDSLSAKRAKTTGGQSKMLHLKETYPDDGGRMFDSDKMEKKLSEMQRAVRKVKKRRHGDMAYEGDIDWEILMHEQGPFENVSVTDGNRLARMKDRFDTRSNTLAEVNNGGATAVAAGLKAHAAGPVEKIKFRDALRRRGGLQEYIECRNFILDLWSKDVCRILPLVDCGVTTTPEEDTPRASLLREIYSFLDSNGYINVGIASEREKAKICSMPHLKLPSESKSMESGRGQATDSQEEVAYILGQVKSSDNLTLASNHTSFTDGTQTPVLEMEAAKTNSLLFPSTRLESSILTGLGEAAVSNTHSMPAAEASCPLVPMGSGKIAVAKTFSDGKVPPETGAGIVKSGQENDCMDAQLTNKISKSHVSSTDLSCKAVDSCPVDGEKGLHVGFVDVQYAGVNPLEANVRQQSDPEVHRRVIIVGAGPAGLTAARHLQRQGFSVDVLEARNRIGGRVYTDRSSLSVPVDLGASIITGVEADVATERRPDPSSLICSQLDLELTVLNSDCPLYDIVTGQKVPADLDEALEAEYNSLLDDMVVLVAQHGEGAMRMSLEEGLEYALKRRRLAQVTAITKESCQSKVVCASKFSDALANGSVDSSVENGSDSKILENGISSVEVLSPLERRVMNWHFANLEYGCAALLNAISLPYWNQDDVYGGFGGAHCMIKGGYGAVLESLGKGLRIHLNNVVTEVTYSTKNSGGTSDRYSKVEVSTSSGNKFVGDAVLITVPLGCLKANTIKFSPVLPDWKQSSIQRLGFGVLNKVVLEFPEVFWDDTVDYFGATAGETDHRGRCFMFWNVKKTVGAPVLIALVVGKAAIDGQSVSNSDHVNHALMVLRKLFGEASVPDPVASVVTNWGLDPFSRGAYSYVAVGASGEDYDILARPVENCLFFAGEATCKEHPDTVGGALMSGLREAVRIIDIFRTGNDYTAEIEAMEAAQRQSDSERNEVRDMVKRLDAVELSNVLCKNSLDGAQRLLTKEALLQDMFSNAKTTSGRLHLIKELLRLPVEVLKSFAGTREGLSTLNSWILDSMGKDGTQLLRHCVRLLVRVSTDLLAVRLSGIGRTIKEKVCVHTSRDIRAVASQLVSMWIEVFRKEKAANGGLKLLRQTASLDSSKTKSKDLGLGKPPLRASNGLLDSRGNLYVLSSAGSHSPSNPNNKKMDGKSAELETVNGTKGKGNSSRMHHAMQSRDSKADESTVLSEEEAAAFAAAEAARVAALAAAEAYASSEAECSTLRELPKIPSFHKFARREHYAQMDESDVRRKWLGWNAGRQDCISEIDSRNCRVRNWSVDFSATCGNLESSRTSGDNYTHQSNSNDFAAHLNAREHSGESVAVDCRLTKAWVDSAGSGGVKDYRAIEMWQSQAIDAYPDFFHESLHLRDEEDSNKMSKLSVGKSEKVGEESSGSQAAENRGSVGNQPRGAEYIKQAIIDYVASLLMPLYKARKIDKEGYKSIMKKSVTKVMDHSTEQEKEMTVSEFLDFKRKNKIRSFVDKLIERHMAMHPNMKP